VLAIHILNVGHGDSIILEFQGNEGKKAFAVIDSNCRNGIPIPRALSKLQELGADSLSFVALTHPHADHYMGMKAILEKYSGKISTFYSFPIDKTKGYIKKLAERCLEVMNLTDSDSINIKSYELIQILKLASKIDWQPHCGPSNQIPIDGFDDAELFVLLPPARAKGKFFQDILSGKLELENINLNNVSLAFLLKYKGVSVVLGGDGTYSNWIYEKKQLERIGKKLNSSAVKIPHHGSKNDCPDLVIDFLYDGAETMDRVACISADGKSHPSPDVIKLLVSKGIKPYCTNLMKSCGAGKIHNLATDANVDPALGRFINSVSVDQTVDQVCQGDITIVIDDSGKLSLKRQYNTPCSYRGEFDHLSSMSLQ
jgi:beta-lactamase superfamily II metal-dependent hydrolase